MHDLTLAAQYADRMVLLDHGRIVADGTAAEVLTEETIATHYQARSASSGSTTESPSSPRRR